MISLQTEDLLEDLAANILSSLWRKSANEEHMIACFRLKGHLLVVQPISDCMHIFRNKVIFVNNPVVSFKLFLYRFWYNFVALKDVIAFSMLSDYVIVLNRVGCLCVSCMHGPKEALTELPHWTLRRRCFLMNCSGS